MIWNFITMFRNSVDKMLFLALMQGSADFVGSRNTRAPLFFKLCLNSFSFLFEKPKYKTFFPHMFRFHFAALSDCKITV